MALGEVLARLIEVRAKMQEAQGLTASAEDGLKDSVSQARDALGGTGNPAALDGLGLYDQVANDMRDVLAALTEADREIARYIDFAGPGHASGTQNTVVPRPTGEAIASTSQEKRSRLSRMADLAMKNPGDAKNAVTQMTYEVEQVGTLVNSDHQPGSAVTSTEVAAKPPTPSAVSQSGDIASTIGITTAMVFEASVMYLRGRKQRRESRRNDRN